MTTGFSVDYTPTKQADLAAILTAHMRVVQAIFARRRAYDQRAHARYVYIDLNAGPGYQHGQLGSPAIALDQAGALGLPIDAWFCEEAASTVRQLRSHFGQRADVHIVAGDHNATFRAIADAYRGKREVYGLIYSDANGGVLPVTALRGLTAPPLGRVDILAHIGANGGYKRNRHLHPDRFLLDDLEQLGKTYLWVRGEREAWQWTFVIASNWKDFPRFKNRGIVPVDSDEGRAILLRLNYSKDERRNRLQTTLPFVPGPPTGHTPNT